MTPVAYDASLIQTLANGLYARARMIEITYTIIGLALVGWFAWKGAAVLPGVPPESEKLVGVLGAIVGGYIGFQVGRARAFVLRLMAQFALVMVQIEDNTATSARASQSVRLTA